MLSPLVHQLQQASNPVQATSMAAYLRHQFPFLGIKSPDRQLIVKNWLKGQKQPTQESLLNWVNKLYIMPEREFQYAACDLLKMQGAKLDPHFWMPQLEHFITTKSWWDTVDVWAPNISGRLLLKVPELKTDYPDRWIESDNFWLQRAAIICQLNTKQKMDLLRVFQYCLRRCNSQEFFVQKAIGWALRSASRYFPNDVLEFLTSHHGQLAPLSLREGSRILKQKGLWE